MRKEATDETDGMKKGLALEADSGGRVKEVEVSKACRPARRNEYHLSLPRKGKTTGSVALIQTLIAEGVDTIFGYPGGAIMPVYDALFDASERIRHILVRHEQGAAHAGEGYARATGRVGVCIATSGPGATNLVTGIADAMLDSVPLLCITGQVVSHLLGSDAFQETDVIGVTIPITKWNYLVREARDIPTVVAKALYVARSGRPGPVVIDITKDAQLGTFDWSEIHFEPPRVRHAERHLQEQELQQAAELINRSERPLLLVGHGVLIARAERELLTFAEQASIPMACTLLGLSACPAGHPLYAGMLGMHGNYAPNLLTNEADLLFAVGMRFDDRVTSSLAHFARQAKVLHIEVDPAEVGKNVKPDVALVANAKEALTRLLPLVQEARRDAWLTRFKDLYQREWQAVIENAIHPREGGLKMSEVVHEISEQTKGEAIVVADVGQHQMMSARYYRCKQPNSFITSGGLGTMGFALPAAVGAKIGMPHKQVVAIIGDGSFQMTLQELGTIAQEHLPVKIVILNNGYLGMVRQWQELFFERRYSFVEMQSPDYVTLAAAFGIDAARVADRSQLADAVGAMLAAPGPYCLEVTVEKEQNVFPMVPAGAPVGDIRLE